MILHHSGENSVHSVILPPRPVCFFGGIIIIIIIGKLSVITFSFQILVSFLRDSKNWGVFKACHLEKCTVQFK